MNTNSTDEPSPYLTVRQLAKRWHTTENAIYTARSRRRGTYPKGFRRGRLVLFPLSEVEAHERAEQAADDRFNPELDPTNAPIETRPAA
ncbi:DNA-binding protein [Streptomyces sp. NPDC001268]|uniref:DNA-binding protein n=1 Tax=Streptomyces sp. NPDC001268 TaxID=3364553 RepID=UPI003674C094